MDMLLISTPSPLCLHEHIILLSEPC